MLDRDEYVEQAYFFRTLGERLPDNLPLQDLLGSMREEILSSTKLPMAVDYLASEMKHSGMLAPAMARLSHYFTAFQTFVMSEAENDRRRFEYQVAIEVLRHEAEYRAAGASPQGLFLYQFETISRNRLRYDQGLTAIAKDPIFDSNWRDWILTIRRQIATVDLADLIYVRSEHYRKRLQSDRISQDDDSQEKNEPEVPILFGEKEGKIALANRRKDPLYLFAAMQRHLGYHPVPRRKKVDDSPNLVPQLMRRIEQMESRIKLLEDDQRGGFDLSQFYERPPAPGDNS